MSKLLFFDLETTGVKFWRNGIHQIGGIVTCDKHEQSEAIRKSQNS